MTAIQDITSKGQVVGISFSQTTTANQSAVALNDLAAANSSFVMPFPYEIVGVSWKSSAASTTGTATIDPTIGGTANTSGRVSLGTATSGYLRVNREKIRGNAGDLVGAKITTSAGWDATTSKLTLTYWVLQKLEGI